MICGKLISFTGDNEYFTGNMTLSAPDGSALVAMERFEDLTSAIDCQGEDGELSVTWKSKEAFDYALKTWKFINDDDHAHFILITNHDGCGEEYQRDSYVCGSHVLISTTFLAPSC